MKGVFSCVGGGKIDLVWLELRNEALVFLLEHMELLRVQLVFDDYEFKVSRSLIVGL
ncbi:hypothetical protein [uncultured Lactococcus sp.]|uniref:hypothetical protein n=1 Tax=uncultured Lactococcus sp. TaxID=167973 RepID=UPI0027DE0231|nr:hypothetical protein [uncultured Lactococcus sp.]